MQKVGFNIFKPTVKKQMPSAVKQQKVTSSSNTAFKTIYEAHHAEAQDIKRKSWYLPDKGEKTTWKKFHTTWKKFHNKYF